MVEKGQGKGKIAAPKRMINNRRMPTSRINKPSIKRLMRRGGVKRVGNASNIY